MQRSGALWLIDEWPDGDSANARYITTVDAVVNAVVDRGPTCDSIVLTTRDGSTVRPTLRPA